MDEGVVDYKEVMERVENDRDLLIELLGIFLEHYPLKMRAIRQALEKKEVAPIKDIAHSLKGAAGNISAKKIYAAFVNIEQMAKNNDLGLIAQSLPELDRQVVRLKEYLQKLKENPQNT